MEETYSIAAVPSIFSYNSASNTLIITNPTANELGKHYLSVKAFNSAYRYGIINLIIDIFSAPGCAVSKNNYPSSQIYTVGDP